MRISIKKVLSSAISIRLLSVILGFIANILVNRALGLSVRGEYTTVTTYANLLQTICNLGLSYAYSPMIRKYGRKTARSAMVSIIWLQTIIYSVSILVPFFVSGAHWRMILLLALFQVLNNQMVFIALIDDLRFRNSVLLASAGIYVFLQLFVMVFFPGNLLVVIACLLLKNILETCLCSWHGGLFGIDFRFLNIEIVTEIMKLGIPTAVLAALMQLNYNVDVYVLNFFKVSASELGIYGVAYSLSNMLWFIPDAFKEMVYYDSAKGHAEVETMGLIVINVLICACICFGFALVGESFLGFIYGDEYKVAFPTVMTVFIGILPMIAFKLIHPIYVNEGRSLMVVGLLCISVVANIVCSCFLVPPYGSFGAAVSTVVSYSVCGILFLLFFIRDCGFGVVDFKNGVIALIDRVRAKE